MIDAPEPGIVGTTVSRRQAAADADSVERSDAT
jgi:hypothetical protein